MWHEIELKINTEVIQSHGGDEREYGSLSCVPSPTPIVDLLHSVCCTGEPHQFCWLAPEHGVFRHNPFQYILIGRCSCLLFGLCRPNVLDEYLTSEVSWRRPVMSLLAISPFLPILSIPCFSLLFAALRLLSLLDIKWENHSTSFDVGHNICFTFGEVHNLFWRFIWRLVCPYQFSPDVCSKSE